MAAFSAVVRAAQHEGREEAVWVSGEHHSRPHEPCLEAGGECGGGALEAGLSEPGEWSVVT